MGYTAIIPVHNIAKRGYHRLDMSLFSLVLQNRKPDRIIISDSSEPDQAKQVKYLAKKYSADYLPVESDCFNMPKLFNRAIEKVRSEYTFCTGVDFLYHPTLFEKYEVLETHDRFLIKEVLMLPNCDISMENVRKWNYPHAKKNAHGRLADGIQYCYTGFFREIGGYDERIEGWCAMDNDMHQRAERSGMNVIWVRQSIILHQWHSVEKLQTPEEIEKTKRNWAIRDNDKTIKRNYIKPE